ncbi:hypothetical protein RHIZ404_200960 [Rhizobium sp. EC-SD404]|nr:hypothetical protein RHIZ404_200960 [Rhizobium sp. EC-SD404]
MTAQIAVLTKVVQADCVNAKVAIANTTSVAIIPRKKSRKDITRLAQTSEMVAAARQALNPPTHRKSD